MTVSDMALQSRRWLQCSERLIAVSAAVGEAIAFHGLVAASVLPGETCAHLSRACVSDLSANGAVRPHSDHAPYLCRILGLASTREHRVPCIYVEAFIPPFRASRRLFIPIAAFGLTRSIPRLCPSHNRLVYSPQSLRPYLHIRACMHFHPTLCMNFH